MLILKNKFYLMQQMVVNLHQNIVVMMKELDIHHLLILKMDIDKVLEVNQNLFQMILALKKY